MLVQMIPEGRPTPEWPALGAKQEEVADIHSWISELLPASFYYGDPEGLDQGPHACVAGTSVTEPAPPPKFWPS